MSSLTDESSILPYLQKEKRKVKSSFTIFTQTENYERAQMLLHIEEACCIVSLRKIRERYNNADQKSERSQWLNQTPDRGELSSQLLKRTLFNLVAAFCVSGSSERYNTILMWGPVFSLKKIPFIKCDTMTLQNASFSSPTSLLSCWSST